jgi:hypothetical protein
MFLSPSILDYLGKYEEGVLVLVGLLYEEKFYESMFYYTSDKMIITIDSELEKKIGKIELHEKYTELMEYLINKVQPYEEIINELSEFDPN